MTHLAAFKAYDIRGQVPADLDETLARQIGRAYAELFSPRKMIIGQDIRDSSPMLANAVAEGLMECGVDVIDIGLCGTEMVYFGAFSLEDDGVDGGIMVTASHNPMGFNGMKLVQKGARPISGDTGLKDIERRCVEGVKAFGDKRGSKVERDLMPAFSKHLMQYVDLEALKEENPLSLVVNAGNGCAGPALDAMAAQLPFTFHRVHHEPDEAFPNGIPNPLIEENRTSTITAMKEHKADLGIAWDGDFDRCFFFDENGRFIEGYYLVGLFGEEMLRQAKGTSDEISVIIHDPRLMWNTQEMVADAGGKAVCSKTGHAFIKERMRKEDAIYGGEMSAHHYFKSFAYCDSGMIPWLLLTQIMCRTGKTLSQLVEDRMKKFPASGEINRRLEDPQAAIIRVRNAFEKDAVDVDETDGLSLSFAKWRFNLRTSNTEPVLRLNVESRGDEELMQEKTAALLVLIEA
ncbi:MAG: phosphomannomutase [Deltaproteobacteria bacterium]|nr:phosphomannomutase [Deltaproteobacteria bacterium]